ncbi:arginine-hydroxylase NDUFAF5, mitochondrial [Folsomia candida]|uniref:arginine-hydroxylase NDUFAF5, mitochondrial n=1 Tax=Folsomia candida TaxID=158441 RepID=UPI000B8F8097|nr:arginine-hydroxylase NDUFAF5, mitochondrial [Folsomia candida]
MSSCCSVTRRSRHFCSLKLKEIPSFSEFFRLQQCRNFTNSPKTAPAKPTYLNVFDRKAKLLQRQRALVGNSSGVFDYLKDEVGFIMADRVIDIKRDLSTVLDLGCGKGYVMKHFNSSVVGSAIATDSCQELLDSAEVPEDIPTHKILMDEENITFKDNYFDLVVSSLNLHWVNNLPKTFSTIQRCLKPDGAFIGAMFGCQTLFELRCALQLAELEREGGMGSHVSPFAEIRDIGGLLTINGFTMLTIDTQEIKVAYPTIFELMDDLKGMAENNANWRRKIRINKETLFAAGSIYQQMYGNEDGSIPATFQIIYMIAWKPDPSQPKPLPQQRPDVSLKDLDKLK